MGPRGPFVISSHCITANAYLCIELNAHSLLNAVFRCIATQSLETFLPWQYGSQQCESFFRNLRSTSITCSTVVNCSLLDAIHRIQRIHLQADISVKNFGPLGENFIFPRTRHLNSSYEAQDRSISGSTVVVDENCNIPSYMKIQEILHQNKMHCTWHT